MKTYQDLINANDKSKFAFVSDKGSEAYRQAIEGIDYTTGKNTAITSCYTRSQEAVPDNSK